MKELTKEQQALWRKEIEEACISGGYAGYQLAKDPRYKENLKVKDVDLDKEIKKAQRKYKTIEEYEGYPCTMYANNIECIAKHFFELWIKASNTLTWEDIGTIDQLLWELSIEWSGKEDNEGYYQDVLKRFKDFKERKDGGKK